MIEISMFFHDNLMKGSSSPGVYYNIIFTHHDKILLNKQTQKHKFMLLIFS